MQRYSEHYDYDSVMRCYCAYFSRRINQFLDLGVHLPVCTHPGVRDAEEKNVFEFTLRGQ